MKLLNIEYGISTKMKIKILKDDFHKYINCTKMFIGGISTGILEAKYNGTPYYIYEPYENGKTDEIINSSKIYSLKSVARDINQLKNMILNESESVVGSSEYIFSGKSFREVMFS